MPLRHRAIYQSSNSQALREVAEEGWRRWISSRKRENPNLGALGRQGNFGQISDNRRARHEEFADQNISTVRITDIVNFGQGDYLVVITWATDGIDSWVQIDGIAPDEESPYQPPKISDALFESAWDHQIDLFDTSPFIRYSPAPQVVNEDSVDDLINYVLKNPERSTIAFIAGTAPNSNQEIWRQTLEEKIFTKIPGMATIWLLDADATESFNNRVPEDYKVFPSSVRAFQPMVNTNKVDDPRRHRWFSKAEIATAISDPQAQRRLQNRLYYMARSVSLRVKLPQTLIEADSRLGDLEVTREVDQIFNIRPEQKSLRSDELRQAMSRDLGPQSKPIPKPAPPVPERQSKPTPKPAPPVPEHAPLEFTSIEEKALPQHSLITTLQQILEISNLGTTGIDLTEEGLISLVSLAEKGSDADSQIQELRNKFLLQANKAQKYEKDLKILNREYAEMEDSLFSVQELNRKFYKELSKANLPEEAYSPPPVSPDSLIELLGRIEHELPHIVFTGDHKTTESLDDRPTSATIARRCWNALQTLEDYAVDYEKYGSVERYLRDDQIAQTFAVDHAPRESKTVGNNSRFRGARELHVPQEVHPSEQIYMEAHFRLAQDGGQAPRMHYYDAMAINGHIYIGYIGPHLPNTMT